MAENTGSTVDEGRILLVAGLGNPGRQYETTRHNIGWQVLEKLSFYDELRWNDKFHGEYAVYTLNGEKIYFIKPQTYMNRSGQSVVQIMQFFKIAVEQVLVIHDELELDFGVMGFKKGGGLAGHNGLRSMAECLGTRDFNRLRMGISRPAHGDITSYVLGGFTPEERIVLPTYLEESAKLLEMCLTTDFNIMQKDYAKKRLLQKVV